MNSFLKPLKRQDGFTLVELMVVVAIIGLLSAVAIPNFKKYQAKAKISEAKLQLAAIYIAEQTWFSDYDNYAACLIQMGYNPIGDYSKRYFATGFAEGVYTINAASVNSGATTNCIDSQAVTDTFQADNVCGFAAGKSINNNRIDVADFTNANIGATTDVQASSFLAAALGAIGSDNSADDEAASITINQNKTMITVRQGY